MDTLLAIALGALTWTALEYGFHRVGGHVLGARTLFGRSHLRHHRERLWFASAGDKARLATAVSLALLVLTVPLVGAWLGAVFTATVVSSYLGYEAFHRSLHVSAPRTAFGRWARRHHLHHHHRDPNRNHGVTSALWDVVFRTHTPAPKVRIPRAKAPPWLKADPERWADEYELLGRA